MWISISGIVVASGVGLRVARGLDEEQAAMYPCILDIPFSLGSKLLSQVCGVLVFDVFHDRVPAIVGQYL